MSPRLARFVPIPLLLSFALAPELARADAPRASAPPASTAAAASDAVVPFAAPESMARLARAGARVDFFHLANHFESQINIGYCGPASATIVLNALRADDATVVKPRDPSLFPAECAKLLPPDLDPVFRRYTQSMFFDAQTRAVKTPEQFCGKPKAPGAKSSPGIELRELHRMLRAHGLSSNLRVVDEALGDAQIRRELVANLSTADDYVIVNVLRSALGQKGGGHLSPLGAYDAASDSFLLLDVNPNGHSWVWLPASLLFAAMRTPDVHENRGYVLVREGAPGS
jgi:hypothetical protein